MTTLTQLLETSPDIIEKSIAALLGLCGDGKLRNGSSCSAELREFLRCVEHPRLKVYISECLGGGIPDNGFILQDIVNEMGRRLGLAVTFGLYQGNKADIGNDGLWIDGDGNAFVIEVKTTDAYRISTDTIDAYRTKLIAQGTIAADSSYNLIVVGRQDTGDLEAQIRGSIHAWRTRIISVDALWKLMVTKDQLDDPGVIKLITQCLKPFEYTRLDNLINLVFRTSQDIGEHPEDDIGNVAPGESSSDSGQKRTSPAAFHDTVVSAIGQTLGVTLSKCSRSLYATSDKSHGCIVLVSKAYDKVATPSFWFAFHPHQLAALAGYANGYVALGCGSSNLVFLIPVGEFSPWTAGMNVTELDDRKYWHVKIHLRKGDSVSLSQPKAGHAVNIARYRIDAAAAPRPRPGRRT